MTFDIYFGKLDERKLEKQFRSEYYRENAYSLIVAKIEYNTLAPAVNNQLPPSYRPKETRYSQMNGIGYGANFQGYQSLEEFFNLGKYAYVGREGGVEFIAYLGRNQIGNSVEPGFTSYDLNGLYQRIRADYLRAKQINDRKGWGLYLLEFLNFWWYFTLGKYRHMAICEVS